MYVVKFVKYIIIIIKNEYLSNVYMNPLARCGRKYASTFEPSSGGIGIKLNTQNTTLNCIMYISIFIIIPPVLLSNIGFASPNTINSFSIIVTKIAN